MVQVLIEREDASIMRPLSLAVVDDDATLRFRFGDTLFVIHMAAGT
jgi:hypothetical protein